MVGVVVVHAHAAGVALELEPAADTAEARQAGQQPGHLAAQLEAGEQGGDRVGGHVLARHRDPDLQPRAGHLHDREPSVVALLVGHDPGVVRPGRRHAVAPHPDPGGLGPLGQRGGARVVGARDEHTARRDPADEGVEHGDVGALRAVVVEVIGLDVGDHRHRG